MDYSRYKTLAFRRTGRILIMSFNRPEARNAVNQLMHTEMSWVFADIAADTETDVVVITGEGSAFSAGGDLNMVKNVTQELKDIQFVEARKIILDMLEVSQPIIAAINGAAAGLGATIGLFCDVIYAADTAKIADPHVLIGLTAGDGGAVIWPALVGVARAKEYLMTGDSLTATEAERIGLINHVLPVDQVLPKAMALATRLCNGSQSAIRSTKRSVNRALAATANMTLELSLAYEKECFNTDFHKKAVAAIAESISSKSGKSKKA